MRGLTFPHSPKTLIEAAVLLTNNTRFIPSLKLCDRMVMPFFTVRGHYFAAGVMRLCTPNTARRDLAKAGQPPPRMVYCMVLEDLDLTEPHGALLAAGFLRLAVNLQKEFHAELLEARRRVLVEKAAAGVAKQRPRATAGVMLRARRGARRRTLASVCWTCWATCAARRAAFLAPV
jgi:hypothetical protein